MSLITTISHFKVPPVKLPVEADNALLSATIEKYEPMFLKLILGHKLYSLFKTGLDAETALYLKIRNGSDYVDNDGNDQHWEGFTASQNPIACYVYWYFVSETREIATNVGVKGANHANMIAASTINKQVQAWNAMVEYNLALEDFMQVKKADYPDYAGLSDNSSLQIPKRQALFTKINKYGI